MRVTPDGGIATVATVGQTGVTVDAHGGLFVSDEALGHILEVRPDGQSTIVATVDNPTSIAVDPQGTIYAVGGSVSDGSAVYRVHTPVAATATPIRLLLVYGLIAIGVGVTLVKASRGRPA